MNSVVSFALSEREGALEEWFDVGEARWLNMGDSRWFLTFEVFGVDLWVQGPRLAFSSEAKPPLCEPLTAIGSECRDSTRFVVVGVFSFVFWRLNASWSRCSVEGLRCKRRGKQIVEIVALVRLS